METKSLFTKATRITMTTDEILGVNLTRNVQVHMKKYISIYSTERKT